MTLSKAQIYLDSFINFEKDPAQILSREIKLERVKNLLDLIGQPQKQFNIVHVAGTNGKGSTCAFVSTILAKAGYKVGLYTSPHLIDVKERIRVLSKNDLSGQITDDQFAHVLENIKPAIEQIQSEYEDLTYFEVLTVAALCHFQQQEVDVAVLEVGMGGRLDATNAVDTDVVGITPIALDHTKILGETIEAITKEKAAIIKNKSQKVVVADQTEEAVSVIQQRCKEFGISFQRTDDNIKYPLSLLGRHQKMNAALAVGIVKALSGLGIEADTQAIAEGLSQTIWPGRLEIIAQNPTIIIDSAHNPSCCQALIDTMKESFSEKRVVLILGLSSDKDLTGVCTMLNTISDDIILTRADHPRSVDPQAIPTEELFKGKNVYRTENVTEALELGETISNQDDIILITGSIFIAGEAKEQCTSIKV